MASLKEIKGRINSVNGTLKITSAMKMVASSKLHKVQGVIANMIPYEQEMHRILYRLLSDGSAPSCTEYVSSRPVKRVAVVAVASNTALCGAFNANAIRHFRETVDEYFQAGLSKEDIDVYAIGKKMSDAAESDGFNLKGDFGRLADRHVYADVSAFAKILIDSWLNREVDRIELVYNHYSSSASQYPVRETYLPFRNPSDEAQRKDGEEGQSYMNDYIIEPDAASVLKELLPKVLVLKIYTMLLDANAAEHAARTMAMQEATDNGNQLLQDLTLQFNKQRQQSITDELLDIVSGSLA